jgi:hypothetical protein
MHLIIAGNMEHTKLSLIQYGSISGIKLQNYIQYCLSVSYFFSFCVMCIQHNLYSSSPSALFSHNYNLFIGALINLTPLKLSCNCCFPAFTFFLSTFPSEMIGKCFTVYRWNFKTLQCLMDRGWENHSPEANFLPFCE